METEKKQNSFRLPMIEMVIILGVFAVISVLIVRMFVSTDRMSTKALNISRAVIETESIAETLKGREVSEALFRDIGAVEAKNTDDTYFIYYDKYWNVLKEEVKSEAKNVIVIHFTESISEYGDMNTYQITAYESEDGEQINESDEPLCDLTVKKLI